MNLRFLMAAGAAYLISIRRGEEIILPVVEDDEATTFDFEVRAGDHVTVDSEDGVIEFEVLGDDLSTAGDDTLSATAGERFPGGEGPVVITSEANADGVVSGSLEEIQSRTDVDGNHAPSPSYLGTPAPRELEAMEAIGVPVGAVSTAPEFADIAPVCAADTVGAEPVGGKEGDAAAADDGPSTPEAGDGDDVIVGLGDDSLVGASANDFVENTISGGEGNDTLAAADTANAGGGTPGVEGPGGADVLTDPEAPVTTTDPAPEPPPEPAPVTTEAETTSGPREASDDDIKAVLEDLETTPSVERTSGGKVEMSTLNTALEAKGFKPVNSAKRNEIHDQLKK